MLDFINGLAVFNFGINNADLMFEERRKIAAAEITIFINGGSKNFAAMLAVPNGIIGAASKKRNAKRCAANNHTAAGAPKKVCACSKDSGVPISMKEDFTE